MVTDVGTGGSGIGDGVGDVVGTGFFHLSGGREHPYDGNLICHLFLQILCFGVQYNVVRIKVVLHLN